MTHRMKDDKKTAELERRRFVDLAYRLVRCTEPEEERRLKEEVLRSVLKRRATRAKTRPAELG